MKKVFFSRRVIIGLGLILALIVSAHTREYSYKEAAVPSEVKSSKRLETLFAKTKLVCFGRYAIEVPLNAKISWGTVNFFSSIKTFPGGQGLAKKYMEKDIADLRAKDSTSEITYAGPGPIEESWQVRFFESEIDKQYGLHFINTYVNRGDKVYLVDGHIKNKVNPGADIDEHNRRVVNLRPRNPEEVPKEPGFCTEQAFIRDVDYGVQEMVSFSLSFPNFPDVRFLVSSNKDAYGDYSKAGFEQEREKLSLLHRINEAKRIQGVFYPMRTLLREGKRKVQHWMGEESLIRRLDGTHDFEWAFVGTPFDVANPSEFGASMYTKVAHNMVGMASASSLSDDEAVALWDRLLSGLKFRVKVPRVPETSYYFDIEPASGPGIQSGK